ncbi:MAG: PIN domain-containing protein [Phycisphaerales bacterium]
MKPSVYGETSVVSYLTSRPSRDLVVAARQEVTRQWWEIAADRFELVISPMVQDEMSRGDAEAVRSRLTAMDGVKVLPISDKVLGRVGDL